MTPKRIISKREEYQDGDLLLIDAPDEHLPAGMSYFPIRQTGDLTQLIFAMFGNNRHGIHLAAGRTS